MTPMQSETRRLPDLAAELKRVIREDSFACTTAEAWGWLAKVEMALARPDDFRGFVGENGWAPAIRACIETADWHNLNPAIVRPSRRAA